MIEDATPDTLIPDPRQNRLLAALPAKVLTRLSDEMDWVSLAAGDVLIGPGEGQAHVYFPTTCIVSMTSATECGASTELAITGNDGVVGFPLVLGGETSPYQITVRRAGCAYRLRAETMTSEVEEGGALQRLALRYTQALVTQMAQSVVCYRHHAIDQQLCRWLLFNLDLQSGNELDVTQELIASKLGVRREGITEAAGKLQADELIRYRRGHITVTDRAGLEARVCECYGVVRTEYQRLFRLDPAQQAGKRSRPTSVVALRARAEANLKSSGPGPLEAVWDVQRVVHELRVHQLELETHNEELRNAYEEADALRAQLADIYDFAPVGYFTLNALGAIIKINFTGAILLDIKRSEHNRHRFAAFVKAECLPTFKHFLIEVLEARSKRKCELVLVENCHRPETVVRIEAVANESGTECRMVVSDVTAERSEEVVLEGVEPSRACSR